MLDIKVKTMNSQLKTFSVPESITIKEFKDWISSSFGISPDQQRLILQGRVLQDDFKLTQEHHEKTLHLVQRLPVSTTTVASMSTESTNPPPTTTQANIFPGPAQISQMFQNTVGNIGQMIGNAVFSSNPDNPNEPSMNLHINVTQSPHQNNPHHPPHQGNPPQPRRMISAPRRQLSSANRTLDQMFNILDQLEQNNTAPTSSEPEVPTNQDGVYAAPVSNSESSVDPDASGDTEEAQPTAQPGNTDSNNAPRTSCPNHPSLQELGATFTRMLSAQRRLEPFQTSITTFFHEDTAFESTNSAEFRSTARLITLTLQAQQMLSHVQQALSQVAIPLGNTPPRVMLVRAQPAVIRTTNTSARPRMGTEVPRPMNNTPRFMPRSSTVVHGRFPNLPHPMHAPLPPFPPMPFNPTAGPRGNMPQFQILTNPPMNPQPTPPAQPTQPTDNPPVTIHQTGSGQTTQFTITPPQYTVQVNATIQPQIQITMDPNAQPTSNSTNQSTTTNQSSTTATTTNQTSGSTHQADVHVIQMNMQTPNPSQISGQLPNIPGLPQDVLSNIFQTVAQQVQQQTGGGLPGGHGHGMVVVQGPPGGPNQIQNDISDIIGQGMMNAVNQHMQNVNPPSNFTTNFTTSSVSQTMPSTATSNVTPTPTVTTAAQTETTNEPTPPVQPTEEVPRIANELLSNGNFGSRPLPSHPTTTSRPTPTQPITTVRSTSRPPRPQTRAVPTPTPPMPPSGGPSLFSQLFASFGMIGGQSVMGIFRPLVESMSDVTPHDMMGIMTNSSRTLAGLRQNLRRNLCQTYFGGRTRNPTYDEIETCTERSSEELRSSFKSLFDGAQVSPDVDVVESNLSLYRHTMRKIIHLTFNGESNFQDNLMRHLENMFCIFIRMNESILRGKRPALVDHLLKFMGSGGGFFSLVMGSVEGGNPLDPMINMAVQHCQITQEQIDQFVMNPKPQTTQADNMDDTASGLMVASDDVVDGPRIEMDDVVASDEDGKKNEASGSEDWKLSVPQEWVDTISSDIEKQKSITPQPPFSEAYLAGMPASKRRKVGKTE